MAEASKYDVYDIEEDKYILHDATPSELQKALGIPWNHVNHYANYGSIYKRRYKIISKEARKCLEEWDRVRLKINPDARK